mmetsp:Transcript_14438/g.27048  ORF Transcript_14438/g.27048 Transcript_14438/m.27048 type:complete len:187 (-) Transcript_14438:181-741(-)
MRGSTLSSRLRRLLLFALAAPSAAGAAAEGAASVPSCPANVELGMVAGDDAGSTGKRPAMLLQMTSPRHQVAAPHEDHDEPDQAGDASEVKEAPRAASGASLLKEPLSFRWNPYTSSFGHLSDSSVLVLPVMALISVIFSCSVVVCFVASYRPCRGKSMDAQFEPMRLGLPAGYGCKPRSNCWLGS